MEAPSTRTMTFGRAGLLSPGGVPYDVKNMAKSVTALYKAGALPTVGDELGTSREAMISDVNKASALEKAAADDLTASFIKLNEAITNTTVKFNNVGTGSDTWLDDMISNFTGGYLGGRVGAFKGGVMGGYTGGGPTGAGVMGVPGKTLAEKISYVLSHLVP
jgi:hypothetical protein